MCEDYEGRIMAETVLALNLSFQGKYDMALIKINDIINSLKPLERATEREAFIEYQLWEIYSQVQTLKVSILSDEQLQQLFQYSSDNRMKFFATYKKPRRSGTLESAGKQFLSELH